MIVLGLTGSIGMGKSTTARMFVEQGVPVHDSDEAVHRLYAGAAAPLVEAAFPGTTRDGVVDRALLAARILGDADAIRRVEAIVHPLVRADADAFLARARASGAPIAVLGAGGAARAVLFALLEAGYEDVRVVNRSVDRARELADRFGRKISAHSRDAAVDLFDDVDLLVNTTSLGMDGNKQSPADVSTLPESAIVTDIVYVPLVTPLLDAAAARGLQTVDGLGMLLHQAAPGFARWFGRMPEVTDELRALVIDDMGRHR